MGVSNGKWDLGNALPRSNSERVMLDLEPKAYELFKGRREGKEFWQEEPSDFNA